jgi:hypothetical protein
VLLLIGDASAETLYRNKHGKSYVQFLEGDYEDWNQDFSQDKQAQESLAEAEKQIGKTMKTDSETMNTALDYHNKLQFDQDGETFTKATSISDNAMVALPTYYNPVPGVTMIQSDPIHGSLGEPKIKMEDLTPEQQFEEAQRRKSPVVFKDDPEQVTDNADSIKWAEENTGGKFPEPTPKKEMKKGVKYTLHDEDDEEEETVETRKSVKTSEKAIKHRFFINAKEKKMYDRAVSEGKVNPKQVTFEEDEDEELGPADPTKAFREAVKKQAKLDALKAKKEEKTKKHLTKEEKEAKEMEDAIAESKKDRADNAVPEKKEKPKDLPVIEAPPQAPTASDLPPELAGELEAAPAKKAAFAQTKHAAYESDSDSDSSDSDSDEE